MKILRITLRNLASLAGTHTVDFTRPPLSTTGLFSISGPTGSGKSTLLDALCLALYDNTPRLGSVHGTISLRDGEKEIAQKDPRNLLRRGTAEGFAEVAFVGVDQQVYTARWSIRRARGKVDGSLQNTEIVLYRANVIAGTEGVVEVGGNKSDVLPAITAKVGLTFAQFTRAVLLAQNDFAVFLKAEDKERAAILQALTATERFERISIAVFDRNKIELEALERLNHQMAGNAPLTPEARSEADTARNGAAQKLTDAERAHEERKKHAEWFLRHAELIKASNQAQQTHDEASRLSIEADPRRRDLEVADEICRDARPLRDSVHREAKQLDLAQQAHAAAQVTKTQAEQQLASKQTQLVTVTTERDRARQDAATLAPQLERARALDNQLEPLATTLKAASAARATAEEDALLAANKPVQLAKDVATRATAADQLRIRRLPLAPLALFAPDAAAWRDRIKNAVDARNARENAAGELKTKAGESSLWDARNQQAKSDVESRRKTLIESQGVRNQAEQALKAFDADKIERERTALEGTQGALNELRIHLEKITGLTTRTSQLESDQRAAQATCDHAAQRILDLTRTYLPAAESAYKALEDARKAAEAAANPATALLRSALRPQHPCAVCGATDHPYSHQAPTNEAAALTALREKEQQARNALDALLHDLTTSQYKQAQNATLVSTRAADLASLHNELATTDPARLAADHPLRHPIAQAILAILPADQAAELATRLTQLSERRSSFDTLCERRRHAQEAFDLARNNHEASLEQFRLAERDQGALATKLSAASTEHQLAKVTAATAAISLTARLDDLTSLFTELPDAHTRFNTDASAFLEGFNDSVRQLQEIDRELNAAEQEALRDANTIAALNDAANTAAAALNTRRTEEKTASENHEKVRAERSKLLDGRTVEAVEAELKQAREKMEADHASTTTAHTHAKEALATAAETVRTTQETWNTARLRNQAATTELTDWITAFTNRTGRELNEASMETWLEREENWFQTERAQLKVLQDAVKTAEGALQVHRNTFNQHTAARPTTDDEATVTTDLAQRERDKEAAEKLHDAARITITLDDERRTECARLLEQLNAQRTKAEPWGQLNELIGSADGAKFRGIAQRRTLDLLLGFANAQLDLLSSRYRLERLPDSLNLSVCDRDMGDERRSIHSLSGGESFLVSLALALGLASLTSNRLRIESLFIDEGFGSLDSATLTTAMNALMQLEAQGRKVGVISHVTEMADAIPVQIKIEKGRGGASRLSVPGAEPLLCDAPNTERDDREKPRPAAGRNPAATVPALEIPAQELSQRSEELLHQLRTAGGSAGNVSLRATLGWEESTYDAVKRHLVSHGRVTPGKGRGGSLSLPVTSGSDTPTQ